LNREETFLLELILRFKLRHHPSYFLFSKQIKFMTKVKNSAANPKTPDLNLGLIHHKPVHGFSHKPHDLNYDSLEKLI